MAEKTVAELRSEAAKVLDLIDLQGVYLATSVYESRFREGEFSLLTTFAVNTKVERFTDRLRCWVRHRVWALTTTDEDLELPDDPDDVSEELLEERLAWKVETEWFVDYRADDGIAEIPLSACSAFAIVMGPPTIHPYAREHVQSVVAKGVYPAFSLPHVLPVSAMPDYAVLDIGDAV